MPTVAADLEATCCYCNENLNKIPNLNYADNARYLFASANVFNSYMLASWVIITFNDSLEHMSPLAVVATKLYGYVRRAICQIASVAIAIAGDGELPTLNRQSVVCMSHE